MAAKPKRQHQPRAPQPLRPEILAPLWSAYQAGNYDLALTHSDTIRSEEDPQSACWYFYRGAILMQLGRLAEAETALRKSVDLEQEPKKLATAYASLGQLLAYIGRFDEANSCFFTGLRFCPAHSGLLQNKAVAQIRQGKGAALAVQIARQAVSAESSPGSMARGLENPTLGENLATQAWAVANAGGERDEVEVLVEQAIRLTGHQSASSTSQVYYQTAAAFAVLDATADCLVHLNAAISADPHGLWGREARNMLESLTMKAAASAAR